MGRWAYHDFDVVLTILFTHAQTCMGATDKPIVGAHLNLAVVYSGCNQKLALAFPSLGNFPNTTLGWVTGPSFVFPSSSLSDYSGTSGSQIHARFGL